jgi:hypothetical protein
MQREYPRQRIRQPPESCLWNAGSSQAILTDDPACTTAFRAVALPACRGYVALH